MLQGPLKSHTIWAGENLENACALNSFKLHSTTADCTSFARPQPSMWPVVDYLPRFISKMRIAEESPSGRFDLIVLSEIG
jgi:hypothetical protein